ncbi:MAG: hydrogenase maturation nickel metallochaperone HypA [bacterium]|nr:hydrogenase maturation nickel metallochaperone HypA [bacterium]
MHELSIITGVIESCEQAAKDAGAGQILKINLKIGERSGVSLEALEFAFEAARIDSMAAGAELELVWIEAQARCLECAQPFRPEGGLFLQCPQCGGPGQLLAGQELLIDHLEVV